MRSKFVLSRAPFVLIALSSVVLAGCPGLASFLGLAGPAITATVQAGESLAQAELRRAIDASAPGSAERAALVALVPPAADALEASRAEVAKLHATIDANEVKDEASRAALSAELAKAEAADMAEATAIRGLVTEIHALTVRASKRRPPAASSPTPTPDAGRATK